MPFLQTGSARSALVLALVLLIPASAQLHLQFSMLHMCPKRELTLVGRHKPCVQAFSQMVPMWKPGCGWQAWCLNYERRTVYYMAYRQVYTTEAQTVFRCCPGWSQQPGNQGCQSVCTASISSSAAWKGPTGSPERRDLSGAVHVLA